MMNARMRTWTGGKTAPRMLEASAVVVLGFLLAGAALAGAVGAMSYSKVSAATDDVRTIGHGIIASWRDNGLSALDAAYATDRKPAVVALASLGGFYPGADDATGWAVPGEPETYDGFGFAISGHQLDPAHEALEGWTGRYMGHTPQFDPWGNKYLVNVRHLFHGQADRDGSGNHPQLAVIVLSAGPNRVIETRDDQPTESFKLGGDDIAFRIQ